MGGRRPARRVRRPRSAHGAAAPDRSAQPAPRTSASCRPTCSRRCPSRRASTACSSTRPAPGLGTLRRDPDIRWRRREGDLPALAAAQLRDAAARRRRRRARRPARSTPPARANPRRTKQSPTPFSRRRPAFRPIDCADGATASCPPTLVDARGHLRTHPHLPRPRSVLRRRVRAQSWRPSWSCRRPSRNPDLQSSLSCSTIGLFMALRTRVWSAGKLLLLVGALVGDLRPLRRRLDAPGPARARSAGPRSHATTPPTKRPRSRPASASRMKVDETRRPDPKIAAGRVLAQDPAAGSTARRQRSVQVWLSAGPAMRRRAGC